MMLFTAFFNPFLKVTLDERSETNEIIRSKSHRYYDTVYRVLRTFDVCLTEGEESMTN